MVQIGDKIKLIRLAESNHGIPDPSWNKWRKTGDKGVVFSIDPLPDPFNDTQIWVKFEDGSTLALLQNVDTFEVIP